MPRSVHCDAVMDLVITSEASLPLIVLRDFDAEDPCAVRLSFHLTGDEPVQRVFARSLLASGMTRAVGEGAVRIAPSEDGACVEIQLCPAHDGPLLSAPIERIALFLNQSARIVPLGRETLADDLDAQLTRILGPQRLSG
jgi:hypothetical protein